MDSPLSPFIKLKCGCKDYRTSAHWKPAVLTTWQVMPRDHRVTKFPANVIFRHDCEKLAVAIEKGSINHWFIIRDESIKRS